MQTVMDSGNTHIELAPGAVLKVVAIGGNSYGGISLISGGGSVSSFSSTTTGSGTATAGPFVDPVTVQVEVRGKASIVVFQPGVASLVSVDGITDERLPKLVTLADAQPNDMPPELEPVGWWPDRLYAATAATLYGSAAENALSFVRIDRASGVRTVVATPFAAETSPSYVRTIWASRYQPGLLLAAVGEPSATAASMRIYRSANNGDSWALVCTLGSSTGVGQGVWLLSDRNVCEVDGVIYMGEYNVNGSRTAGGANDGVAVWRSTDGGVTWAAALRWNISGVHVLRHIHALKLTPAGKILICTGDSDAESALILWDRVTDIGNVPYASLPSSIPALYGSQRHRPVDVEFWGGRAWYMADGTTLNGNLAGALGIVSVPDDLSAPVRREDGKIIAYNNVAGTYAAQFSNGCGCYIEETSGTVVTPGRFNLGVWLSNEGRTRFERVGEIKLATDTTGPTVPVMFQHGDTVFVTVIAGLLGKSTTGTVAFTVSSTKRFCGVRPDTLHPVHWIDPVAGVDDAATGRGSSPASPWRTLGYAIAGNRIKQGGRLIAPAGDFEETFAATAGINPDLALADSDQYLTIDGAGIGATKYSSSAATTTASALGFGLDANAGLEIKDFWFGNKRDGSGQAIVSGAGASTAQRLRVVRARLGSRDTASTATNRIINTNIGPGGSITCEFYDSQLVGHYVNGEWLITGDADGPVNIRFIRSVADGAKGLANPLAGDVVYAEDSLFHGYQTAAVESGAAATVVPQFINCRFSSLTGVPQYKTNNAGLVGAGQFVGARSLVALAPGAFFDRTSRVDTTAAPLDPLFFDYSECR